MIDGCDKLFEALYAVLSADENERRERELYQGNEWGYYGSEYTKASCQAKEDFMATLNELIDARVRKILNDKNTQAE